MAKVIYHTEERFSPIVKDYIENSIFWNNEGQIDVYDKHITLTHESGEEEEIHLSKVRLNAYVESGTL